MLLPGGPWLRCFISSSCWTCALLRIRRWWWVPRSSWRSTPRWSCSCAVLVHGSTQTAAGSRRAPRPGKWCSPWPWTPGWWLNPAWTWGKRVCCWARCRWSPPRTASGWRRAPNPKAGPWRSAWRSRCRFRPRCWRCRCTCRYLSPVRNGSPASRRGEP